MPNAHCPSKWPIWKNRIFAIKIINIFEGGEFQIRAVFVTWLSPTPRPRSWPYQRQSSGNARKTWHCTSGSCEWVIKKGTGWQPMRLPLFLNSAPQKLNLFTSLYHHKCLKYTDLLPQTLLYFMTLHQSSFYVTEAFSQSIHYITLQENLKTKIHYIWNH